MILLLSIAIRYRVRKLTKIAKKQYKFIKEQINVNNNNIKDYVKTENGL